MRHHSLKRLFRQSSVPDHSSIGHADAASLVHRVRRELVVQKKRLAQSSTRVVITSVHVPMGIRIHAFDELHVIVQPAQGGGAEGLSPA